MSINLNINAMKQDAMQSGNVMYAIGSDHSKLGQQPDEKAGNKSVSLAQKAVNPIAQRKEQAFEKARKIVSDAFDGERQLDAQIQEVRDLSARLTEENKIKMDAIQENDKEMEDLKEQYAVAPDSQEQKDLELLMKQNDSFYDPSVRLTEEERSRMEEIQAQGKTEYQSRMMERHEESNRLNREMQENLAVIRGNGAALRSIASERLKVNPIGEAEDAAEKVLEAESDALMGALVSDAMDHVQEELTEETEAARERAEEKAELEERVEAAKENKEQQEQFTEETKAKMQRQDPQEIIEIQSQVQAEIDKVLEELKLLAEDLKGNAIDKLL